MGLTTRTLFRKAEEEWLDAPDGGSVEVAKCSVGREVEVEERTGGDAMSMKWEEVRVEWWRRAGWIGKMAAGEEWDEEGVFCGMISFRVLTNFVVILQRKMVGGEVVGGTDMRGLEGEEGHAMTGKRVLNILRLLEGRLWGADGLSLVCSLVARCVSSLYLSIWIIHSREYTAD